MFQDENSYDGKTFFLPNEGEMILDAHKVKLYYYPYFKSAEFDISYEGQSILYRINEKEIRCDFSFKGDTLVFNMNYINKNFVKLFVPIEMEKGVIHDLDKYGFRTHRLKYEFELDTLHPDQRKGFSNYDSLNFTPYQHIEFKSLNSMVIDRKYTVNYEREYKKIKFGHNGVINELEVFHLGGTQDIFLRPVTQCGCDSIVVPYIATVWADRIRQAIIDEENF